MNIIATALLLMLAFVDVPLQELSDYKFSEPIYTNYISGRVMGPKPAPYTPLRGEDQVYLWEAWSEMDLVSRAYPNSTLNPNRGLDRTTISKGRGGFTGTAWNRIYNELASNTNIQSSVSAAGRLVQRGKYPASVEQMFTFNYSGGSWWSNVARIQVIAGSAAASTTREMEPLGLPLPGRVLASTNVAAFYQSLAGIWGIANDFNAPNSTNVNKTTSRRVATEATFDYETGQFTYTTLPPQDGTGTQIGGGLYESTLQQTRVLQRQFEGESVFSRPLPISMIYSFEAEDKLEVPLFTNTFARAIQLSNLKSWVVSSVNYTDYEQCWSTPTSFVYTANSSTNAMVAAEASSVSFFERDGMVHASVKPDYADSYNQFFKYTGLHPPDDGYFPKAPGPEVFKPGESTAKENQRTSDVQIYPRRLALVVRVTWHSGINSMAQ